MVVRNKVLGMIGIYDFEHEYRYNEQDLQFMSTLANQAAIALDNAQFLNKIKQITKTYPSISELSTSIDFVLQKIADITKEVLDSDVIVIYKYDQRKKHIMGPPIVSGNIYQPQFMKGEIGISDEPYWFIERGKNYYAYDSKKDIIMNPGIKPIEGIPERFLFREKIESSAAILLRVGVEIVGVLFINYRIPHNFDENEKQIIELYSSYIALAIQNVMHFYEKERVDKLKTLGEITERVTHIVRNKLQSIKTYIDSSLKNITPDDKNFKLLKASITIMENLKSNIDHLLDLSRIKINKIVKIKIETILSEFQTESLSIFEMNNVQLDLNIKENIPILLIDPSQIKIVFSNLLDNSIYYMKDGGIINISVFKEKETLYIEWSDTGPGVSKEALNKIFNLAFTTKSNSFGLGLYHSRAILEEYGGSISVDNSYKDGAKFIIKLPIIK